MQSTNDHTLKLKIEIKTLKQRITLKLFNKFNMKHLINILAAKLSQNFE